VLCCVVSGSNATIPLDGAANEIGGKIHFVPNVSKITQCSKMASGLVSVWAKKKTPTANSVI